MKQSHYSHSHSHRKTGSSTILFVIFVFLISGMVMIYSISFLIQDKQKSSLKVNNQYENPKTGNQFQQVFEPFRALTPEKDRLEGLEKLKEIGGTGTYTNPVTNRQEVSAFARNFSSRRYEHIECPDFPAPGYPKTYPMKQVLDNWNPDDTSIPQYHFNSLCYFDYQTELKKALNYRNAELPFIVYNIPEVEEVVHKWSNLNYLNEKVGVYKRYKTATSEDNHFMYYSRPDTKGKWKDQNGNPWKKPTGQTDMTFSEWVTSATENHNKSLANRKHFYFRVSTDGPNHWVFNELPFFQPKKSFFMVEPEDQRGIHCRFGMRSVISENHWDGSRNYAITFSGLRRWILNHPNQCKNLYMFPNGHPSARHSAIDWSKPDYAAHDRFATAETNEVIVKPGDALYLPTNWFHYIISLNINVQCNTRSGRTTQYDFDVRTGCGL